MGVLLSSSSGSAVMTTRGFGWDLFSCCAGVTATTVSRATVTIQLLRIAFLFSQVKQTEFQLLADFKATTPLSSASAFCRFALFEPITPLIFNCQKALFLLHLRLRV